MAQSISPSLAKKAVLIKLDGELRDLERPLDKGGAIEIVTRDSPDALETIRHDTAHVLAEAVQALFPGTQVTIGPSIEDGFYYDFARDEPFSIDDFAKIEAKMREIIDRDAKIVREEWDRDDAIKHFEKVRFGRNVQGRNSSATCRRATSSRSARQGDWVDLVPRAALPLDEAIVGKAFKLD